MSALAKSMRAEPVGGQRDCGLRAVPEFGEYEREHGVGKSVTVTVDVDPADPVGVFIKNSGMALMPVVYGFTSAISTVLPGSAGD
jgi:hypothetical protein